MSKDVISDYLKTAPDCNLQCFLQYLTKAEGDSGWSAQDRWKQVVSRKLIWRFVDQEYFKLGPALKAQPTLARLDQQTWEPANLFLSDLKRSDLQAKPQALVLRAKLLTNISRLHNNLSTLVARANRTELLEQKVLQKTRATKDEALFNTLMMMNDSREKAQSIVALNNPGYHCDFLTRFGNSFCQICSYDDTFSDDDFFIYCEVG